MKCIFKRLKKSSLSIFNDKRNYLKNNESLPWNYFFRLWRESLYICFYNVMMLVSDFLGWCCLKLRLWYHVYGIVLCNGCSCGLRFVDWFE